MRIAIEGNQVAAYAMKQVNPDVVAAYPITPSTEVVQEFSKYVSNGEVTTEFVPVESEHSAISACLGASLAGARVMNATASQGLALMYEILPIFTVSRAPMVLIIANRALSGPINIHCDHGDAMAVRDTGWIQIFSENAQEIYDNIFIAVKLTEHPEVMLPAMVNYDGFITSHSVEVVETLDDEVVRKFVGTRTAQDRVTDTANPYTVGPLALTDSYFEYRVKVRETAYRHVFDVFRQVADEYAKISGRHYDLIDKYMLDDADVAMVVMGSTAGTARVAVDQLRKQGKKVGLLKIRMFRPFPKDEVYNALKNVKVILAMDRHDPMASMYGALYYDLVSIMYEHDTKPLIIDVIYGLGGRDTFVSELKTAFELGINLIGKKPPRRQYYLNVRSKDTELVISPPNLQLSAV